MANGENRAAIKKSVDDVGKSMEKGFKDIGEGLKKVTLGIGKGISDVATGTVDAILNPETIPNKLDSAFDRAIIQPTKRTVDFIEESAHKVAEDTDRAWNRQVKQAQEGARNLRVVFAQPLHHEGSFAIRKYPKSDPDNRVVDAALKSNFVFDHLSPSKRDDLVSAFEPIMVKKGTKIITEGEQGDFFYIIGSGEVAFEIGGKMMGTASSGASFGELALLYQAPRAATCVAKTQCGLFRLDQETFRRIMAQQIQESKNEVCKVLKNVPYFKDLDEAYLLKIANNLRVVTFQDGDVLTDKMATKQSRFFIIKEGEVNVTGISVGGAEYKDTNLKRGEFFGEVAIVTNKRPAGKAVAKGQVVVLTLDRDTFVRTLGSDYKALVQRTVDKKKLGLIPFGKRKGPADNELDLLASKVVEKKFPKGHIFFTEGKRCTPALYLMREGEVSISSSNDRETAFISNLLGFNVTSDEIKKLGNNAYFGNDTLGDNEKGEVGLAKYTVRALDEVVAGVLDQNAIRSVVAAREVSTNISRDDLTMVRILGAGTFGKVWLVKHNGTDEAYALKVQVKKQLIEYNQAEGVIREKNIMTLLNHPFIIRLVTSYQDDYKLYMLLKMYQGGELQTVIHTSSRDGIPEWAARFYSANILVGLSYMHNRNVIYRDLKPENVLLDSDGYTVIIDLGFAKIVRDKTYTFCGTPLYLAPEIIMQKGHDKGADLWSWGVMLYEMIAGKTPFYDGIVDQMGLYKNIVKCRFEFPDGDFMSASSIDLIKRMLTVDPNDRLGCFAGAEKDIMNHPFYEDIDWKQMSSKKAEAPFKPKVKDPLDGSNFDDYSKLEAKEKNAKTRTVVLE